MRQWSQARGACYRLLMATPAVLLLLANDARGESSMAAPVAGAEYEISKSYETSHRSNSGSSGSSRGRDTVLERVITVREDGLELEYDLPKGASAEDRARSWQFPVRVLRSTSGSMKLLNRPELEARVEAWLKTAGWTRAACGTWIFTWNAFLIECNPESVIKTIEAFDLRYADLRDGASYREPESRGTGTLTRNEAGPKGASFSVTLEIDPSAVRRARADSDVATGEILGKPVTLESALLERAKERVSGTISVSIDTDSAGSAYRRTKVTKLETEGPDGKSEAQTVTETVERRTTTRASILR